MSAISKYREQDEAQQDNSSSVRHKNNCHTVILQQPGNRTNRDELSIRRHRGQDVTSVTLRTSFIESRIENTDR